MSQAARGNPSAQKKIRDHYAAMNNPHYTGNVQGNPITLPAHVGYPYDDGDVVICIDTATAEKLGVEFYQNGSFAILTQQRVNP